MTTRDLEDSQDLLVEKVSPEEDLKNDFH